MRLENEDPVAGNQVFDDLELDFGWQAAKVIFLWKVVSFNCQRTAADLLCCFVLEPPSDVGEFIVFAKACCTPVGRLLRRSFSGRT